MATHKRKKRLRKNRHKRASKARALTSVRSDKGYAGAPVLHGLPVCPAFLTN